MKNPSHPARTITAYPRWSWTIPAAGGVSWLIGFMSIFLIAPSNVGVDTWTAYKLFQTGSNFGNILALVLWSCAAVITVWLCLRGAAWIPIRALCAYGVSAVLSLYPTVVIGNAVSHVVAIEDGFAYHDGLAGPLAISGFMALSAALVLAILAILARRPRADDSPSKVTSR